MHTASISFSRKVNIGIMSTEILYLRAKFDAFATYSRAAMPIALILHVSP